MNAFPPANDAIRPARNRFPIASPSLDAAAPNRLPAPSVNGENKAMLQPLPAPSVNGESEARPNQLPAPSANGEIEATLARLLASFANGENHTALDRLPAPSANPVSGRDSLGRFTKGNKGGPGNPFARQVAQMRSALCQAVTREDIQAVARWLLARAKEGDLAAIKLLFAYTIGRPVETVDPDTLDFKEWRLYQQATVTPHDIGATLKKFPADLASTIVGTALPIKASEGASYLAEQLEEEAADDAADDADQ